MVRSINRSQICCILHYDKENMKHLLLRTTNKDVFDGIYLLVMYWDGQNELRLINLCSYFFLSSKRNHSNGRTVAGTDITSRGGDIWLDIISIDAEALQSNWNFWTLYYLSTDILNVVLKVIPHCICIAFLCSDWSRTLAPLSQPIRCKNKTNHDLVALVFQRFRRFGFFTLNSHWPLKVFSSL